MRSFSFVLLTNDFWGFWRRSNMYWSQFLPVENILSCNNLLIYSNNSIVNWTKFWQNWTASNFVETAGKNYRSFEPGIWFYIWQVSMATFSSTPCLQSVCHSIKNTSWPNRPTGKALSMLYSYNIINSNILFYYNMHD